MKKLFAGILIALVSISAMAQHHHGYRPSHRHHGHYNWVAPLIIGGVVGYAITRPPVVEQPVIVAPPPQPQYTGEVVYINGRYYRRDVAMINGVWQEVLIPQ